MKALWIVPLVATFAVFPALSQAKEIELVLRLQERVSMERLAQNVTDPRSPRYRKFYSPEEIRSLAGPSDFDYTQLEAALETKGFHVVNESATRLFITVRAETSAVENTFSTQLQFSGALHRNIQPVIVPNELHLIRSVIGMDNTRSSRPLHRFAEAADSSRDPGGDPNQGKQPAAIRQVYGFDPVYHAGITGKGQHIAIATYGNYREQDVRQYWAYEAINPAPKLDTVYFNGKPDIDMDAESETELDSEFSGMIAPNAQIHVFPSAHNDDPGEVQLFTAILDDNRAKVVNYSWGDCEANVTPQHFNDMNTVFARAVAQGVNITVAAGDWGSYGCPTGNRGAVGKVNADWPAANPYVLAVGGTSLDGSEGPHFEETWQDTGGGVSTVFPRPSWQNGGVPATFTQRAFPDVAFNADPITGEPALVHYQNYLRWLQIGGTSIGAPQWAGFLALVGEARSGLPGLGFLNPVIYTMPAQDRAASFHDTIKGNNGAYKAAAGWDATTGWGSMRASVLLDYLRKH